MYKRECAYILFFEYAREYDNVAYDNCRILVSFDTWTWYNHAAILENMEIS